MPTKKKEFPIATIHGVEYRVLRYRTHKEDRSLQHFKHNGQQAIGRIHLQELKSTWAKNRDGSMRRIYPRHYAIEFADGYIELRSNLRCKLDGHSGRVAVELDAMLHKRIKQLAEQSGNRVRHLIDAAVASYLFSQEDDSVKII